MAESDENSNWVFLLELGFSENQAKAALRLTSGNVEQAAELLFTNPGVVPDFEALEATDATPEPSGALVDLANTEPTTGTTNAPCTARTTADEVIDLSASPSPQPGDVLDPMEAARFEDSEIVFARHPDAEGLPVALLEQMHGDLGFPKRACMAALRRQEPPYNIEVAVAWLLTGGFQHEALHTHDVRTESDVTCPVEIDLSPQLDLAQAAMSQRLGAPPRQVQLPDEAHTVVELDASSPGTSPGGFYRAVGRPTERHFIKFPVTRDQVGAELTSAALARAMELPTLGIRAGTHVLTPADIEAIHSAELARQQGEEEESSEGADTTPPTPTPTPTPSPSTLPAPILPISASASASVSVSVSPVGSEERTHPPPSSPPLPPPDFTEVKYLFSPVVELSHPSPEEMSQLATPSMRLRQFVHAVWVRNWDASSPDNLCLTPTGTCLCVDYGGSLVWRAMGHLKDDGFNDEPLELLTMKDPDVSPEGARVFAGLDEMSIAWEIRNYLSSDVVSDETVREAVALGQFGHANEAYITHVLLSRRTKMTQWSANVLGLRPR